MPVVYFSYILILIFVSQGVQIVSTPVRSMKTVSLFGDIYTLGTFEFEFDQELQVTKAFTVCEKCPVTQAPACPPCYFPNVCDYSREGGPCPCVTGGFAIIPCLIDSYLNSSYTGFDISHKEVEGTVTFYTISLPLLQNCEPLVFRTGSLDSWGSTIILSTRYINESTYATPIIGDTLVGFCPEDQEEYLGSLVVQFDLRQLHATNVNTNFRSTILPSTANYPDISACVLPGNLVGTHECIPPGTRKIIPRNYGEQYLKHYAIPVPKGQCIYLSHGGDNLVTWMSFTDPYVNANSTAKDMMIWYARPVWVEIVPYHRQSITFVRYVCIPDNTSYLYAQILFETQMNNTQLTKDPQFWFSVTQNNLAKIPFSDMQSSTFSHNFIGDITVKCGNKTFNNLEGFPAWVPQDSGILNLRAMWPTEDPHYFYPIPIFLGSDQRIVTTIPELGPLIPKKFTVGVLLDWDRHTVPVYHPADTVLPLKTTFLTPEEFNTCTVEFHGAISGVNDGPNDKPLIETFSNFVDKDLSCDYDTFIGLTGKIQNLLDLVIDTVTVADVLNLTLVINQIENTDMYCACSKYLSDKITTYESERNYFTDSCVFEPGSTEFDNDDCCNPAKSDYGNCTAKNVVAQIPLYGSSNTDGTSSTYCAAHLLQKLQNEFNRVKQPGGCRDPIEEIAAFRGRQIFKYLECRRLYSTGKINQYAGAGHKECIHDSDCYPGNCTLKGFCIQNINDVTDNIINCVLNTLDPFVISKVKEKSGKQPEDNVTASEFREIYSRLTCLDDTYLRFPPHKQVYAGCAQPSGCPQGTSNLLAQNGYETDFFKYHDIYDIYPFGQDCLQQCTSSRAQFEPPTFGQSCDKIYCNWFQCDPALITDVDCQIACNSTYPTGSSFCGLCEDGLQCIDYTDILPNQTVCESSKLCILNKNRTTGVANISIVSSTEECNLIEFCDICQTGDCSTQDKCESPENGYCTDSTDYDSGIWVREPFKSSKGACSVQIKYNYPFDQTRDYDCIMPSVKTVLGYCLDPNITESQCTVLGYNNLPSFAHVVSAEWIRPAETQSECESFYPNEICFRAPNYEFSVAIGYANIINRPYTGEQQCTGSYRLPFTWVQGKWRTGQSRDLSWRVRDHSNRVHINQIAFDFNNFSDTLSESVTEFYGLKLQDELYCSHALTNSYLEQLSCFFFDNDQSEENCISKQTAPIVAISSACTDSVSESSVPPFNLIFNKSFTGIYRCERVIFRQIPRLDFKNTKPSSIALLLINYGEDDNFTRRNSLNAVYGKILTDGLNISCNEDLSNVTIRITKDEFSLGVSDAFPDLMVAELSKNDSLRNFMKPLPSYIVEDTGSEFVFTLDYINNGSTYFVMSVVHVDDPINTNYDTDVNRVLFEPGEVAYLVIIVILYAIGCFTTFIKILLYFTTAKPNLTSIRLFFVLFTIFSFFLFRTVLFSLIVTGSIVDTTSPGVGYVLIEFPIILFFSFVTQYIVLWFFLVKITSSNIITNWIKYANIIVLMTNTFIFTMFIVLIILFETIVQKPTVVCNNEVSVYDSATAFVILMIYRAIFSFISFALGFLLLLSGARILTTFRDEMPIRKMTKIGIATAAGTFGLIAQGIFYLVLTATGAQISNYITLSILLVVEIIPAYCFLILAEVSVKVIREAIGSKFSGSESTESTLNQ